MKSCGLGKIEKKLKFFESQLLASLAQDWLTLVVVQVDACGKPYMRREKCRIERLCILTWRLLVII